MYRLSRSAEKKLKIFFYLVLHIGHGCFGPKFHISSIFRFVSIALGSGKIKIFQNFGFFWKWHTLMGKEWSKVLETQYFWVMVPQKNFGHFWRHWPAHFFTTRWMRSCAYNHRARGPFDYFDEFYNNTKLDRYSNFTLFLEIGHNVTLPEKCMNLTCEQVTMLLWKVCSRKD